MERKIHCYVRNRVVICLAYGGIMRKATLQRSTSTEDGTFGKLTIDDGIEFYTGELPWRDNHSCLSCIPAGTYTCKMIDSPAHGSVYQVMDVPNRSMIEIHSANFCGDTTCGKKADLLGCIGLGKSIGTLDGQECILSSHLATTQFYDEMNGEDFQLTIISG